MRWFKKREVEKEIDYLDFAKKALDYIRYERKKGTSEEDIKQALIDKKYPDNLIEYLFKRIDNVQEINIQEEIEKTLVLGKKYLLKTNDITKTFDLMKLRVDKILKGGNK